MKEIININKNWIFIDQNNKQNKINLPHTWNNIDGQDGGDDYYRGTLTYLYEFENKYDLNKKDIYLEFKGANASSKVYINDQLVGTHDNGYSTLDSILLLI